MLGHSTSTIVAATLWVLISFSLITWTLIVVKGWLQWQLSRQDGAFSRAFWQARGLAEARASAGEARGPLARLCRAGFDALEEMQQEGTHNLQNSGDKQDILERRLRSQVQKEQHGLESGLMVLASIGSTAPFVGLFGTVVGIIHAFTGISTEKSTGLAAVAGGISEALVTTAIGLFVAIPAVWMFNYFTNRIDAFDVEMGNSSSELIDYFLKRTQQRAAAK